MFSYRHAFHAGSHADVLKHIVLLGMLDHLTLKETALTVVDTHAGAGLYRLDGDYADKSGEAMTGVFPLFHALAPGGGKPPALPDAAPLIQEYMALVASFNAPGQLVVYPGSPFVIQRMLRDEARDRLRLFELHPTDIKALTGNIAQLQAGRQITITHADGFEGLKALLPPPSRRGLVLIDPSYEIKSDYARVSDCVADALGRFATGTYAVWYPVIPRPEAHELPRRLKTICNRAGKPWLNATLAIGQGAEAPLDPDAPRRKHGLTASGMFVVNPPHTLKAALQGVLPQLLKLLGRGAGKGQTLESHG